MSFKLNTLDQLGITLIDGDRGKSYPKKSEFTSNGYCLFLSAKNITKSGLNFQEKQFIDNDKDKQLRAGKLQINDIVITTRGTVGNVAYFSEKIEYKNIRINSGMLIVRSDDTWDNQFVYYILISLFFKKQISSLVSGSAVPQLPARDLKKFLLPCVEIATQKKIANILSTLDDKIELNRKMNQTLEDMAQALFKSWFVDFDPVHALANKKDDEDIETIATNLGISKVANSGCEANFPRKEVLELFPCLFEDSELGMIPKGWGVEKLNQFGDIVTGKTPSTKKAENYDGRYPFITIPDMHSHLYIDSTVRTISEIGNKVQPKKLIPKDSLIVSCIATVGLVGINTKDSHTNQQINSIVCEKKYLYYLYNLIKGMKSKLEMLGSAGTTTLNVNKSTFENIEVLKPNDEILNKFLLIVESSYEKILKNTEEIQTLQKARDTLLPKLLSGEIEV